MSEVEVFRTGSARSISIDDWVTVRVGSAFAVLTAGEWARLIASPKSGSPLALDHDEFSKGLS